MPARICAALALMLTPLAGCADAPPWIQSASANSIVLRWYPSDADPLAGQAAAQAKAGAHCAQTSRQPTLVATGMSGSVQMATYECR